MQLIETPQDCCMCVCVFFLSLSDSQSSSELLQCWSMVPAVNRNRSSRGSKEENRDGETYGAEERGAGSHDSPGFCCCRPCNGTPPCRLDHHAFHQKKLPVTTPTPLNSKIRHAEKTRTKNTPELYCCCYHLHNAASSSRRFPTRAPHSSQQLLALSSPHFRTKPDDDDDDKNTTAKLNARYYHSSILTSEYNTDQC